MPDELLVSRHIRAWPGSVLARADDLPWRLTQNASAVIESAFSNLTSEYQIQDGIAVHPSAVIETGAVLKDTIIIGPRCFVAAGAYLRGGVFLDADCIVGPNSELKTSFMFQNSKIAHLNFVGDSILGSGANVEAGAIIANYRNERADKAIRFLFNGETIETGVDKFGALLGDGVRVGANAVVAPGAILKAGTTVGRLQLVDQSPAPAARLEPHGFAKSPRAFAEANRDQPE